MANIHDGAVACRVLAWGRSAPTFSDPYSMGPLHPGLVDFEACARVIDIALCVCMDIQESNNRLREAWWTCLACSLGTL